jgi:hypothetical protein
MLASVKKVGETRNTRRAWCFCCCWGREVRDNFAGLNVGISVRWDAGAP